MNPNLLPGDVLLCDYNAFTDRLIKFGESITYHGWLPTIKRILSRKKLSQADPAWPCHAAVYVGNGKFIEATARGLTVKTWDDHTPGSYRVAPLSVLKPDVTDANRADLVKFAWAAYDLHGPYGWLSIASIVVNILTPAKLDFSWGGALICSAFAARCWEHAGVVIPRTSILTVTPADLAWMLDKAEAQLPSSELKEAA